MQVGKKEIFITFRVEKSDYFRRDGQDIHTDAIISLSQAVLGGSIRVQGIYEDQTIQVLYSICKKKNPITAVAGKYFDKKNTLNIGHIGENLRMRKKNIFRVLKKAKKNYDEQ